MYRYWEVSPGPSNSHSSPAILLVPPSSTKSSTARRRSAVLAGTTFNWVTICFKISPGKRGNGSWARRISWSAWRSLICEVREGGKEGGGGGGEGERRWEGGREGDGGWQKQGQASATSIQATTWELHHLFPHTAVIHSLYISCSSITIPQWANVSKYMPPCTLYLSMCVKHWLSIFVLHGRVLYHTVVPGRNHYHLLWSHNNLQRRGNAWAGILNQVASRAEYI